nr:hypothetical protein [Pseudomonadota bacterium]
MSSSIVVSSNQVSESLGRLREPNSTVLTPGSSKGHDSYLTAMLMLGETSLAHIKELKSYASASLS